MNERETNDLLKLISLHRFHNPLHPKACELCRVETYRQDNTPTVQWSKAISRALRPPLPVLILLAVILIETTALALTL
jgi:hypothetical protein